MSEQQVADQGVEQVSEQDIYQDINSAIEESGLFNDQESNEADPVETQEESSEVVTQDDIPEPMKKAMEAGWTPREKFKGDADAWVDYEEFNRRAPLFKRIHEQEERNKKLEKKLDSLVKWNKNVEHRAYEQALANLKAQQKEAVELGDVEAFEKTEKQIEALNERERLEIEAEEATAPQAQTQIPEPIQKFAQENEWFDKDKDMTDYMTWKFERVVSSDRTLSMEAALEKARAETLAMFKDRATTQRNPNKDKPATVMSRTQETRPKTLSMSELTQEQRAVYQSLRGVLSEEEFLKQLEAQS